MTRGRKPVLKAEFEASASALERMGIKPFDLKDYQKTPLSVRKTLQKLLHPAGNPAHSLPEAFLLRGDWLACVVYPDGKTAEVRGENLRAEPCAS